MLAQARVDLYNQPTGLNLFAGGLTVLLFALAAVGLFGYLRNLRGGRNSAAGQYFFFLVYGGVAFQLVHMLEHTLQFGFWIRKPYSFPWLTPWALAAQKGLTNFFDPQSRVQSGGEILHLLGNLIFLFPLVAIVDALKRAGTAKRERRFAVLAFWSEAVHSAEHVVLTSTWYLFGVPRGFSTFFGYAYQMQAPWASGVRIIWHFLLNLVPTVCLFGALAELRRAGLLSENGFAKAFSSPRKLAVETGE